MDRKRNRWAVQIRPDQVKKTKKQKEKKIRPNAYPRDKDIYGSEVSKSISTEYSHFEKTICPAHNLLEPKLRCLLLKPVTCQSSILLKWDSYYSISVSAVYSQPKKEKKKQLSVFVTNTPFLLLFFVLTNTPFLLLFFVLFEKSNFLRKHHLLSCLPFKNV